MKGNRLGVGSRFAYAPFANWHIFGLICSYAGKKPKVPFHRLVTQTRKTPPQKIHQIIQSKSWRCECWFLAQKFKVSKIFSQKWFENKRSMHVFCNNVHNLTIKEARFARNVGKRDFVMNDFQKLCKIDKIFN